MKTCTKCKQTKDLSGFTKRKSKKDGLDLWCKSCCSVSNKAYRTKNKEEVDNYNREYRKAHRKEAVEYNATYRVKNREQKRIRDAEYYQKNKDKIKAKQKNYYTRYYEQNKEHLSIKAKTYRKTNSGKVNAWTAKRHAAKLEATPKWLTEEHLKQIEAFYVEAARLTRETGVRHEVDHIVPLQSKKVRGLHVPWNLQVLTKEENNRKKNALPSP